MGYTVGMSIKFTVISSRDRTDAGREGHLVVIELMDVRLAIGATRGGHDTVVETSCSVSFA